MPENGDSSAHRSDDATLTPEAFILYRARLVRESVFMRAAEVKYAIYIT